jgi:hypothetical protein
MHDDTAPSLKKRSPRTLWYSIEKAIILAFIISTIVAWLLITLTDWSWGEVTVITMLALMTWWYIAKKPPSSKVRTTGEVVFGVNLVLLCISGVNVMVDAYHTDHHKSVLICSIDHDDNVGSDTWELEGPQLTSDSHDYLIDPGRHMGKWYSDPGAVARVITPGKTYDITYHGTIGAKYVTAIELSRENAGTCGDDFNDDN